MAPGSVIVDLAGESGGNCELTRADEVVIENGVKILAPTNLASDMSAYLTGVTLDVNGGMLIH